MAEPGKANMTDNNNSRLLEYTELINRRLSEINEMLHISGGNGIVSENCADAVWWSLSSGGKRIRPILTMEFCRVCGGLPENAVDAAAAVEMIHTYSLIHDDLPCMDNDDFRRGRLSCHKKFGEAFGLLAGDTLLTHAFSVAANSRFLSDGQKAEIVSRISGYAGIGGMIGGQVLDLSYENGGCNDILSLTKMYSKKTGALLKCACEIGCISADGDSKKRAAACEFAENLGIAFQITDDILDVTQTTEELGKPAGSDEKQHKTTFVSLKGLDYARVAAAEYTEKALKALEEFDDRDFLVDLTSYLLNRKN